MYIECICIMNMQIYIHVDVYRKYRYIHHQLKCSAEFFVTSRDRNTPCTHIPVHSYIYRYTVEHIYIPVHIQLNIYIYRYIYSICIYHIYQYTVEVLRRIHRQLTRQKICPHSSGNCFQSFVPHQSAAIKLEKNADQTNSSP